MKNLPENFAEIIQRANGMMKIEVYEEIAKCASFYTNSPTFLEIGTAHGASAIALALGSKAAYSVPNIYTIDKLGGKASSRSKYGTTEENKAIIEENFKFAEVENYINLFIGTASEFIKKNKINKPISILLIDADGKIDRDLIEFYPLLTDDATIIIDDVGGNISLKKFGDKEYLGLKHKLTQALVNKFESSGHLILEKKIFNTLFLKKGKTEINEEDFVKLSLECYRDFFPIEISKNDKIKSKINILGRIKKIIKKLFK